MALAQDYESYIEHRLRIMGLVSGEGQSIFYRPGKSMLEEVNNRAKEAEVLVVVMPDEEFAHDFNVTCQANSSSSSQWFIVSQNVKVKQRFRLRTLADWMTFKCVGSRKLLYSSPGNEVWISVQRYSARIIFVGTDIVADMLQYSQGDPNAVPKADGMIWGFSHERPNYLFAQNIAGQNFNERFADNWSHLLATCMAEACGHSLRPILPGGAKGVIVLTGDDDEAYLEKYNEQLAVIGGRPMTYFLHPNTRHNRSTLDEMLAVNPNIDFGLHPDALDSPAQYPDVLRQQVLWFCGLVGEMPRSVRNHGYLNNGYWKHAKEWMASGIEFSTNVPGLNGSVVTGSLLPGRLFLDGKLTDHWSVLTAIGDGVLREMNIDDEDSADLVKCIAHDVLDNGIPGVIVCNLHPQNIETTKVLHRSLLELEADGFLIWNMSQCHDWFTSMERVSVAEQNRETGKSARKFTDLSWVLNKFYRWFGPKNQE